MSDRFARMNDSFEAHLSNERFARVEAMWAERRRQVAQNGAPYDEFRPITRDDVLRIDLDKPSRVFKPYKLTGKFRVHWADQPAFDVEYIDGALTPESEERFMAFTHGHAAILIGPRAIVDRDPGDEHEARP